MRALNIPNRTHVLWTALLVSALFFTGQLAGSETVVRTNAAPVRIGVYDSRALAYAWFWSKEHQADLDLQRQADDAAHKSKDLPLVNKLDKAFAEQQESIHRQVFAGATPTEALAVIQKRLPELQRQTGASGFVSRWDAAALKANKSAEQVDVTDALVREFNLDAKQLEVVRQIQSKPLVNVDRAD